jgi:hypothetical protein
MKANGFIRLCSHGKHVLKFSKLPSEKLIPLAAVFLIQAINQNIKRRINIGVELPNSKSQKYKPRRRHNTH